MCISELLRINYWKPQQQYKGSTESASIERTNELTSIETLSFLAPSRAEQISVTHQKSRRNRAHARAHLES